MEQHEHARHDTDRPSGVFILLPVLNEIDNIGALLRRISEVLTDRPYTIGILDDGSTDGTVAYLQQCLDGPLGWHLHVIRRTKTARGSQRGGALHVLLLWGLENTRHQVFVEMDGDLSHRPEELLAGVRQITGGRCDIAIASKYVPGSRTLNRPVARRLVSRLCSAAVSLLISRRIRDYSNGYRFYSRAAARIVAGHRIRYTSPIYLSEVLALWLRSGQRVLEMPTIYVGRNEGISKLRIIDLTKAALAAFELGFRYHIAGFAPLAAQTPVPEPALEKEAE